VNGRPCRGDLYVPGDGPLGALVLIPGAAPEGKDDPRLVAFALTLARARFAVLVPELAGMRSQRLGAEDIGAVADAVTCLAARTDLAPTGRVGIAAFSYAVGPAILAALQPEVGQRVSFILAVGGYYRLRDALTFFTTGWYRDQGVWRHRVPNEYGTWFFVRANARRLKDPQDGPLLAEIARQKMTSPAADVADLAAQLGPEGRRVYAFVTNSDPSRVPELLAGLPAAVRADIAALDLADRDLSPLRARLILVHGLDDDIIPYTESVALAEALPSGQASLFLVKGLLHVDLVPGLRDGWKLWRASVALLRERDRRK